MKALWGDPMKRLIGIVLLCLVLTGCRTNSEEKSTTIFYAPHADDEVLSMGAGILHHLALDDEVIVVLLSEGKASKAFNIVNEKLENEGRSPITIEEFGQARVTEFQNSVAALGVSDDNRFIYNLEDGKITSEEVASIIYEFEGKYPNALHNVMSYNDPHRDHAASGKALKGLKEEKKVHGTRYYIPIQEHENMNYDDIYTVKENDVKAFNLALEAYGKWAPDENSYSIGYMSVLENFKDARKALEARWHHE